MKNNSNIQSILKGSILAAIFCAVMPIGMSAMAQNRPKQAPAKKDTIKKEAPAKDSKSQSKADKGQKPAAPATGKPSKKG
ncbi:hypothetical protein DBR43_11840 [Pedobacter sp. KBW06]|uniref:hypothetical protein n=1 Tax=Pedobacter sp. KBW06 TaxID=2153359 RepID=UPI000F5AB5EB|nr:hypothetical protein [Pedobacter sp. KBW06]RQO71914.1 hypothetical protein DBR43_11840 [Pedobacter sp. KBW06]